MNTPAHLLLGAAAFGRRGSARVTWSAMLGGLLPDVSLYLMGGVSLYVLGISPQRVFNELYFSDAWQTVFAIDNSFLVWGLLLALAWRSGRDWAIALCCAALLHIALDFPLHHDDGRPHFWPLSGWVFESPVSYWDIRRGAGWVAPMEAALCVLAVIHLWRLQLGRVLTAVASVLLLAELWIVYQWLFVFVDS